MPLSLISRRHARRRFHRRTGADGTNPPSPLFGRQTTQGGGMGLFGKSYDTIEKARAASRMTMGFVGDGHSALESRGESPHGRLRRSVRVKPDGISATANRGARSRTQYRPVQIAGAESDEISTCANLSVAQVDFSSDFPPGPAPATTRPQRSSQSAWSRRVWTP